MGLPTELPKFEFNGLEVCYSDTWPTGSHVSHDTWPIKVNDS
jgi:hypothetical protein